MSVFYGFFFSEEVVIFPYLLRFCFLFGFIHLIYHFPFFSSYEVVCVIISTRPPFCPTIFSATVSGPADRYRSAYWRNFGTQYPLLRTAYLGTGAEAIH